MRYVNLLLLYMSIIMVALSHYCCRTTLQCQCHAESLTQVNSIAVVDDDSLQFQ